MLRAIKVNFHLAGVDLCHNAKPCFQLNFINIFINIITGSSLMMSWFLGGSGLNSFDPSLNPSYGLALLNPKVSETADR